MWVSNRQPHDRKSDALAIKLPSLQNDAISTSTVLRHLIPTYNIWTV